MQRKRKDEEEESDRKKKRHKGPPPLYTKEEITKLQCRRDDEAKKGNLLGADTCRRQLAEAGVYD